MQDNPQGYVITHLRAPGGALIVVETGGLKNGTKSIGVQRLSSLAHAYLEVTRGTVN